MKLLDLFCCCGGISKGFVDNGFECTGVDITDDHQYPYNFIQSDVFDLPLSFFEEFDIIHASPPCQNYTWAASLHRNRGITYPDLVGRTRQLLNKIGKPYIMENVLGAPLRKDLVLCGVMFGLEVVRHRIFEILGFTVLQPSHIKHKPPLSNRHSAYPSVAGHGGHGYTCKFEDWKKAMGIDWVTKREHLTQMIPPKYSEYISKYFPMSNSLNN